MIIPHPTEPRIIMLPAAGGWALPSIRVTERIQVRDVSRIARSMRHEFGIDVTVLRCADVPIFDKDSQQVDSVYVLENHSPTWTPPDAASWVERENLAGIALAQPVHRSMLEAYLDEADGEDIPDLRPAWARPGWFDDAVSWFQKQLARQGYALTSPVEQVRTWGISSILRARTSSGDVYFKVAARWPLAAHEPALMEALARMYPDNVPDPLAIDHERRWMLLPDLGRAIGGEADVTVYEDLLRTFGQIQRESAARKDELLEAGCVDRRLHVLEAQIDPLLEDANTFTHLSAPEMEQIRALGPELKRMCNELTGYKIPPTLVHGDFTPDNVALQLGGDMVFFDWTDGCVSHPFLDLVTMLDDDTYPVLQAVRKRLVDVYLSQWLDYEPMARLKKAQSLARPLGALHQAVTYQSLVPDVEVVMLGGLELAQPFWLRKMLQFVDEPLGSS